MLSFFYDRPRFLALALLLITVSGLGSWFLLPRTEDPRITNRAAAIITPLPGAPPERVEALIAEPLEKAVRELAEVKDVVSTSRAGVSTIDIETHDWVGPNDINRVWSRVRDKIADTQPLLPANARPELIDEEFYAFTLIAGVTWDADTPLSPAVLTRTARALEDRLKAVRGTEYTAIQGEIQEIVYAHARPRELAALGLTVEQLGAQLAAQDADDAAGRIHHGKSDLLLQIREPQDALAQLADTVVAQGPDGQSVRLGDIAEVYKQVVDPMTELAIIDGRRGVLVSARATADARVDRWAARARAAVQGFDADLAEGLSVHVVFDQSSYTVARFGMLTKNFVLGIVGVIVVMAVVMGWRSALLVGLALPLTALMVLSAMRLLEVPLHQMSVTGIVIALGLLIDNAIVMVDEIQHRLRSGIDRRQAIQASVRHLALPLFGSTATTALAFMPIVLMPGGAGEFVGTIGLSVVLAVVASFILSVTVLPAIAGHVDKIGQSRASGVHGLKHDAVGRRYESMLTFVFKRPAFGIGLAVVMPITGLILAGRLDEQFFPSADRDQFQVQLTLASDTPIHETADAAQRLRAIAMRHPDVQRVDLLVGNMMPSFYYNVGGALDRSPSFAHALVKVNHWRNAADTINTLQRQLDESLPEAQAIAMQLEQGPPSEAAIALRFVGPDTQTLAAIADEARWIIAGTPGLVHTRTTQTMGRPKLAVTLNDGADRAGLRAGDISRQLDAQLQGASGGTLREGSQELPIQVRIDPASVAQAPAIGGLDVYNGSSRSPLSALAQVQLVNEPGAIVRRNVERTNTIQGFVTAGTVYGQVLSDALSQLDQAGFALPPGYRLEIDGQAGDRNEAIGNLLSSAAVLLTLVVTALVLSLGSFRLTAVIGGVALLAVGLSMAALYLFNLPIGFMAIVGTFGLVGVAINDSIVVLAALKADDQARAGDLKAAVNVVRRATRHVLATTFTTIAGFLPLLLAGGGFWPPMAITIAAGVAGATLLALVFVPVAFRLIYASPSRQTKPKPATTPLIPAPRSAPAPAPASG